MLCFGDPLHLCVDPISNVFVRAFAAPVSGACQLWTSACRDTQKTPHAGLLGVSLPSCA